MILGFQPRHPLPPFAKAALVMGRGSGLEELVGDTVGRVGGLPGAVMTSTDNLKDPTIDGRDKEHRRTADMFSKAYPDQMKDVKLRLGGTDVIDDMRRVWTNQRTGPLGKVVGTLATPPLDLLASLVRGTHYNPWSNTVTQFGDSQPMTEHMLGSAVDDNDQSMTHPGSNWLSRQIRRTPRDLYTLASGVPGGSLWHQAQAARKGLHAVQQGLKDKPDELARREADRLAVIPSFVGAGAAGGYGMIPGRIGGKLLSEMEHGRLDEEEQNKPKAKKEKKPEKKASLYEFFPHLS